LFCCCVCCAGVIGAVNIGAGAGAASGLGAGVFVGIEILGIGEKLTPEKSKLKLEGYFISPAKYFLLFYRHQHTHPCDSLDVQK